MKYNFTCLVVFIVTALLNSCDIPLSEIAQEQGSEGEEIRLFHGDTESWVPTMNPNYQRLCRGRFFHYHPHDDTVYTKFIMESGAGYGTIISGHIDESVKDSVFYLPTASLWTVFLVLFRLFLVHLTVLCFTMEGQEIL